MRLGVIMPGVRSLDIGAGCIWVNSDSSLDSLGGRQDARHVNIRVEWTRRRTIVLSGPGSTAYYRSTFSCSRSSRPASSLSSW